MTSVPGFDATHSNLHAVPASAGQAAGYTTGSADIMWTAADWARYPRAVRIDQSASARDHAADVLDIENGAATPGQAAAWCTAALASYQAGTRPGQRRPAVYVNQSNLTAVANALTAAGITGIGVWLANYNLTRAEAEALVTWGTAAGGPYPMAGVQYSDKGGGGAYDLDVFSDQWLSQVSGRPPAAPLYPVPAGITAVVRPVVTITWAPGTPVSPHWRVQVARDDAGKPGEAIVSFVTVLPHATLTMPGAGLYWYRAQAAGNSPFSAWTRFAA